MAIFELGEMRAHLNLTASQTLDDDLIVRKLKAAQEHVERELGYKIEEEYPDGAPETLKEAIYQLAAWWYDQRETAIVGVTAMQIPFGVREILINYRNWSF